MKYFIYYCRYYNIFFLILKKNITLMIFSSKLRHDKIYETKEIINKRSSAAVADQEFL